MKKISITFVDLIVIGVAVVVAIGMTIGVGPVLGFLLGMAAGGVAFFGLHVQTFSKGVVSTRTAKLLAWLAVIGSVGGSLGAIVATVL